MAGEVPHDVPKKVTISTTPIVLSFFAEKQRGTRDDITFAVYNVASKIRKSEIQLDAIFRGALGSPSKGNIQSETVDEEIVYWLSNKFLKECNISRGESLCFEVNKPDFIEKYRLDRIKDTMSDIYWKNDQNRSLFIDALTEAIHGD